MILDDTNLKHISLESELTYFTMFITCFFSSANCAWRLGYRSSKVVPIWRCPWTIVAEKPPFADDFQMWAFQLWKEKETKDGFTDITIMMRLWCHWFCQSPRSISVVDRDSSVLSRSVCLQRSADLCGVFFGQANLKKTLKGVGLWFWTLRFPSTRCKISHQRPGEWVSVLLHLAFWLAQD